MKKEIYVCAGEKDGIYEAEKIKLESSTYNRKGIYDFELKGRLVDRRV